MTFAEATEELEKGNLVAREDWNGKNMFLFMRPEDELDTFFIINKVKSLPQSLKNYYMTAGIATVKFTSYLCMKAADGTIVNGWSASQRDMLSKDWVKIN